MTNVVCTYWDDARPVSPVPFPLVAMTNVVCTYWDKTKAEMPSPDILSRND